MFIAKVIGNVWATKKHPNLKNLKLLIVKPLNENSEFCGKATLAVDVSIGAGTGDRVLVLDEGGSARKILDDPNAPIRTLICGIVDNVYSGSLKKSNKSAR